MSDIEVIVIGVFVVLPCLCLAVCLFASAFGESSSPFLPERKK